MTGRRPGAAPVGLQVLAGRSTTATATRGRVGSRTVVRSCRHLTGSGSTADCQCPSRSALPVSLSGLEKGASHAGDDRCRPPHGSHTAAALDEHGQLLDQQRIPATLDGYQQLPRWAGRWPQRCWAVEGAHGIGRALAQRLAGDGEPVLDVPAKLAARVLSVGHGRTSDPDDAVSAAVAARTQTINRLHPGGARRNLTANRAAGLLAAVTPVGQPAVIRWQPAGELVADVRQLEQQIAAVEGRIKAASPRPTPPWSSCSGSGRCWRPGSWVRSAMWVGSGQASFRRPHRHRPAGGLQRPGHPPSAVAVR
jgi:hypothetical protein